MLFGRGYCLNTKFRYIERYDITSFPFLSFKILQMKVAIVKIRMFWLVILATSLLSGCVTDANYGNVKKSMHVDSLFKSGELDPRYKYYYNGPDGIPIALLALDRNYQLKSQFWHEFTEDSQLQNWMDEFQRIFWEFDDIEYVNIDYRGMALLDPEKKMVGMIYTRYHWVTLRMGEEGAVYVSRPQPSGSQRAPFMRRRW